MLHCPATEKIQLPHWNSAPVTYASQPLHRQEELPPRTSTQRHNVTAARRHPPTDRSWIDGLRGARGLAFSAADYVDYLVPRLGPPSVHDGMQYSLRRGS